MSLGDNPKLGNFFSHQSSRALFQRANIFDRDDTAKLF